MWLNKSRKRRPKLQIKESEKEIRKFDRKMKQREKFMREQKRQPKGKEMFLENPPSIPDIKRQENQKYWLALQLVFFLIVFVCCAIWLGRILASH